MKLVIINVIFLYFQIKSQIIDAHGISENEHCGRLSPNVRHYIYGGKSAHIEQWPWQVLNKNNKNNKQK